MLRRFLYGSFLGLLSLRLGAGSISTALQAELGASSTAVCVVGTARLTGDWRAHHSHAWVGAAPSSPLTSWPKPWCWLKAIHQVAITLLVCETPCFSEFLGPKDCANGLIRFEVPAVFYQLLNINCWSITLTANDSKRSCHDKLQM